MDNQINRLKKDEQINAVQRMQNYIENHLEENITQAELAGAAMFSPWYSYRLFKAYTGLTPADYIRRLRLSKSAMRLKNENCKIIDVAFDMGFGSADGYTRAFCREFNCNPKEYALNPFPISLFIPYGVKYKSLWKENFNMENLKNVFIQTIEKPARKVIIKRGKTASHYMDYCNEVGCDVWGILKSISDEPVSMWLPKKYRPDNTSEYVQGAEVGCDYNGNIPEGFDIIELPACKYIMFQGEPFREEDYCDAIVMVQEAAKKYNPSVMGLEWNNENPRIQLEPIGERGYIELYPVTEIRN